MKILSSLKKFWKDIKRDGINPLSTRRYLHRTSISYDDVEDIWQKEEGYWINDKLQLHRKCGPAWMRLNDGDLEECWYLNGQLHREGGPAWITGTVVNWYQYGQRHNIDGPAVVYLNNNSWRSWYFRGEHHKPINEMTLAEFLKYTKMRLEDSRKNDNCN